MNIAIIEDLQLDYETLRDVLKSYASEQHVTFDLHWFPSGEAFWKDFSSAAYDHNLSLEEIFEFNNVKLRQRHGETYNPAFYRKE